MSAHPCAACVPGAAFPLRRHPRGRGLWYVPRVRVASFLARGLGAVLAVGALVGACGGKSELYAGATGNPFVDGGGGDAFADSGLPPGCGDGKCASNESCSTCPLDCGLCPTCGNGTCDAGETCSSCAQDCGNCATCGDGFCNSGETCLSCAPDCGICPGCGDGTCTGPNETCFTCPKDCGVCAGCGDGRCEPPETCASCQTDCGVCAVCGNGKCEAPYETCTNCHEDCGDCKTIGCLEMLTCALGCVDFSMRPPNISVTCIADCVSRGCPTAQFFFNQAFNCFIQNFSQCGPSINCLMMACQTQTAECIAYRCP